MTNETVIQSEVTGPDAPEVEQQDELLAGKFKSQDDLIAAYKELEGKLGAGSDGGTAESGEPNQEPDQPQPQPTEFFPAEKTDEMKAYEVETYGPQLASVFDAAGMDAAAVSRTFHETGELPAEAYDALAKQGYSQNVVDAYLSGTAAKAEVNAVTVQADVDAVKNSVGGVDEYDKMMGWAQNNLSPEEVTAFNEAVSNGKASATFAVEALYNRFTGKMGSEPTLVNGRPGAATGERFNSTAELTAAMKDPRYKVDEAYRQQVTNKLAASSLFKRA